MTRTDVDVLIVGARCAGAALACFLRRRGASVLLVDKDALPSDYTPSTHALHASGMRVLEELGVADAVRAGAPAMRTFRLEKDGHALHVPLTERDAEYCPRRARFDAILLDAALAAGAALETRARCVALCFDGDRVCGARVRTAQGEREIRARWVVGADGRSSFVADALKAPEYHAYEAPRAMYWGYFPVASAEGRAMHVHYRAGALCVAFATEHDHVLVGALPEVHEARAFAADPLVRLREAVAFDPLCSATVARAPAEPVRGVLRGRYFLRRPVGPGWALVGDAGVTREFLSGDGMSAALRHAKLLAGVLCASHDDAGDSFWAARDRDTVPSYFFYKAQGAAGPRPRLEALLLSYTEARPALKARMAAVLRHECAPLDVLPAWRVADLLLRRLARADIAVLRDLRVLAAGQEELRIALRRLGQG